VVCWRRLGRSTCALCHIAQYSHNGPALERSAGDHGTDLTPKGYGDHSMSRKRRKTKAL
jgi:hypothetical protein